MTRKSFQKKNLFPIIFSLILLFHLTGLWIKLSFDQKEVKVDEKPMVVKLLTDLEFRKQIVQSEDSENKDVVVDKAFLSDKNRAFTRQTRSRNNDIFSAGQLSGGKKKQGTKNLKLSDLGQEVGEDPFKQAAKEYTEEKHNGPGKKSQTRKISSTNDYLEDIPLGDMTHLNTVEYVYYGFYHRIRQKLEQFWGRSLYQKAESMNKDGRRMPASEEVITALEVTLDHLGNITAIKIKGTSGIKELDDAAVESFNEAGPFPNPPKGLVVNGKVVLEWGFVVKS